MLRVALCLIALPVFCSCRTAPESGGGMPVVRVGFFPNVTHAQAILGSARGDFQKVLGDRTALRMMQFNAGPSVIEALFAGQIDLAYIGPNPAINGFVQSRGEALRIVAGCTSGGASLVVHPESGIHKPEDLPGKRIASPQLGNTQDVALRSYLVSHRMATLERGGSVEVIPVENPLILDLFRQKQVDAAWVPEPWASRLIVEGRGRLFLDERDLWPRGDFVTTHIIARTEFLRARPGIVKAFLSAHVEITQWAAEHPEDARRLLNAEIGKLTGKPLHPEVLAQAWSRLRLTWDPIASSLQQSARLAYAAGFLKSEPDLTGIYDLTPLNEILKDMGQPEVR